MRIGGSAPFTPQGLASLTWIRASARVYHTMVEDIEKHDFGCYQHGSQSRGTLRVRKLLDGFDDFADGFAVFFREFDLIDEREEHGSECPVEVAVGESFELAADVLFAGDGGGEAVREAGGVAGDVALFLKAFEEAFDGGVKGGLVFVVEGVHKIADGAGLLFPEEAEEREFGFGGGRGF